MRSLSWKSEYQLVSDAEGKIEALLIVVPESLSGSYAIGFDLLIAEFQSTDREIIKLINDTKDDAQLPRTASRRKVGYWGDTPRYQKTATHTISMHLLVSNWQNELDKIKETQKSDNYRLWIQDPIICFQRINNSHFTIKETTLIYSIYHDRLVDFLIAAELAKNPTLNLRCHPSELILEGGNMLFVDEVLFVGKDLIDTNRQSFNRRNNLPDGASQSWKNEDIIDLFEEEFNVEKVIVLGTKNKLDKFDVEEAPYGEKSYRPAKGFQPLFHLDLFLNFGGIDPKTGKRYAFLGNPQLALDLLKKEDGKDHPLRTQAAYGFESLEALIADKQKSFDEIRKQLQDEGLTVVDIPLYLFYSPEGLPRYYSWNNTVLETGISREEDRIYIPSYLERDKKGEVTDCKTGHTPPLAFLEQRVVKTYNDHKLNVRVIRAGTMFRGMASYKGSLRCMVKVLRRKV